MGDETSPTKALATSAASALSGIPEVPSGLRVEEAALSACLDAPSLGRVTLRPAGQGVDGAYTLQV